MAKNLKYESREFQDTLGLQICEILHLNYIKQYLLYNNGEIIRVMSQEYCFLGVI